MNVIRNDNFFILRIPGNEKNIFLNSIFFVIDELGDDLFTRTGFYGDEYQTLTEKIKSASENFSESELIMIHQVFNEICHGIFITDFEKIIGSTKTDVRNIFDIIDNVLS